MTATPTFDQVPPRRPDLSDLGGGAYTNDVEYPPIPGEQPQADDINQMAMVQRALAATSAIALVTVHYSGTPFVERVASARTGLLVSDFTVTLNGAGDVSIDWPNSIFPAQAADPVASVTGTTPTTIATERTSAVGILGARVRTGAALTPFVLAIY